jgi:alkanesulfonate monooxygenase SsuD/methylene tetrahydromethanopterin reductase-like flavin-dependent oxidoreductase (luciferase family)
VDFGAHLPLMDFGGHPFSLAHLTDYVEVARRLGFAAVSANDHLVFAVPWLDGPTALAVALGHSGGLALTTSVSLPVVRGPVPLAKTLGAIDRLSGGRLVVAVGPGSSARDYAAVGIDYAERWGRLDEAIQALRALWRRDDEPFVGRYYSTEGVDLQPAPTRPTGPPIWLGTWGSDAGLRRAARLGDGWLASAYNTTPDGFADAWSQLRGLLAERGRDADAFPNALATMWCYITESRSEADEIFRTRLTPTIHRPEEMLRERLPVGPADAFAQKLVAFRDAGVQRVFIWPVHDERRQLELFAEKVRPAVAR